MKMRLGALNILIAAIIGGQAWGSDLVSIAKQDNPAFIEGSVLPRLGSIGPYIKRQSNGTSTAVPDGYVVDRVVSLARHGERHPDILLMQELKFASRRWANMNARGSLKFLRDYKMPFGTGEIGKLTRKGKYNGVDESVKFGKQYRDAYGHLLRSGEEDRDNLRIFAGATPRIVDTAENFARGLLGDAYETLCDIEIIQEGPLAGANSLSPIFSCFKIQKLTDGMRESATYFQRNLTPIRHRLNKHVEGGPLINADIDMMMTMCAYELNARGESKFCQLFTEDEWDVFEKKYDLETYYRTGPGSSVSTAIGSLFMNATLTLLSQADDEQRVYPCFAHDVDLQAVFSTLGVFDHRNRHHKSLPEDAAEQPHHRAWTVSQVTPMAARLIIERLQKKGDDQQHYIRLLVNDAVVPIRGCGMPNSTMCKQSDFEDYIKGRLQNYADKCRLPSYLEDELKFFWE